MPRIGSVLNVDLDIDNKAVTFSLKVTVTELKNVVVNFNNKYHLIIFLIFQEFVS